MATSKELEGHSVAAFPSPGGARRLLRVSQRVFNVALLTTPDAAAGIGAFLVDREEGTAAPRISAPSASMSSSDGAPYVLDGEGVATINVHGELVNRGSWMDAMSRLTSYKAIGAALDGAAADPKVRGIVLDIDSPGGEAAGAMETAAAVRAVAARKPVVAFVDSLAASAAYAIAAGASEIVATPSATLGSIGVVWLHLDRSAALKTRGVRPTLLHAGAYKTDGNSLQALPDDARARIQAQIDGVYGLFLDSVGLHRPPLGREGARATNAGLFLGARAVDAGLADRVGGLDAVRAALARKPAPGAAASGARLHPRLAAVAAVAAVSDLHSEAIAKGIADERARILAILDSPAAKGRQAQARHLAFKTGMSPDEVIALLEAAPVVAPAADDSFYGRFMRAASPSTPASRGAYDDERRVIDAEAIFASRSKPR